MQGLTTAITRCHCLSSTVSWLVCGLAGGQALHTQMRLHHPHGECSGRALPALYHAHTSKPHPCPALRPLPMKEKAEILWQSCGCSDRLEDEHRSLLRAREGWGREREMYE